MVATQTSSERGGPATRRVAPESLAPVLILGGFGVWLFGVFLTTTNASVIWTLVFTIGGGALLTVGFGLLIKSFQVWWLIIAIGTLLTLAGVGMGPETGDRVQVFFLGLAFMMLLAVMIRLFRALANAERERAGRVIADERRRIAGEVHDVVGHTMAVTMLHLTSARLALRTDPDAAVAALDEAERQGRHSMNDIRSVVRLLRSDDAPSRLAPADSADIEALVDQYRIGGADITLDRSLDTGQASDDLPATASLAAYRVVQEGLTNAVRHGHGPIDVAIHDAADAVDITITNDIIDSGRTRSTDHRDGSGLAGMRERIDALGGSIESGPASGESSWRLHARIPR